MSITFFCGACTQLSVQSSSPQVRFQSNQEVVQETVAAFPTSVLVPVPEMVPVRERLQYFFHSELGVKLKESPGALSASTERFAYRISYTGPDEQGHMTYNVVAHARVPQQQPQAELNAKNLARFIRDGIIERSLGAL